MFMAELKKKTWRGLTEEEVKKLSFEDFLKLIPSRERRSLKRGLTYSQKRLLEKLKSKDKVKTHARELVILPEMLGKNILVYNGKSFVEVRVTFEMLGHRLGEYSLTRKLVKHQAPGVGATRSSAHMSVR